MTGTSEDIVLDGKRAKTVACDSEGIADSLNGVEYVALDDNAADGSVNLTGDEPVINFEEGGALAHLNDSPSSTGQSGDRLMSVDELFNPHVVSVSTSCTKKKPP